MIKLLLIIWFYKLDFIRRRHSQLRGNYSENVRYNVKYACMCARLKSMLNLHVKEIKRNYRFCLNNNWKIIFISYELNLNFVYERLFFMTKKWYHVVKTNWKWSRNKLNSTNLLVLNNMYVCETKSIIFLYHRIRGIYFIWTITSSLYLILLLYIKKNIIYKWSTHFEYEL